MIKLPQLPWVAAMESVLGLHEKRDRDRLAKWLKSDGKTLGDPAQLPWCGDAVDTAISIALPKEPRPGDLGKNVYWALNWMFFGTPCPPLYGCVAAFKRTEGGHVGFLVGQTKTHYFVLGGNQGDCVSRVLIGKNRCVATSWPSTYVNPRVMLPLVDAAGKPVSSNEA